MFDNRAQPLTVENFGRMAAAFIDDMKASGVIHPTKIIVPHQLYEIAQELGRVPYGAHWRRFKRAGNRARKRMARNNRRGGGGRADGDLRPVD